MTPTPEVPKVRYTAEIRGATEVTLSGTADRAWWTDHLRPAALHPVADGNRARLLISSVRLRWMGLRFQELSLALPVSFRDDGGPPAGFYLVGAFNSSRLMSFCERTLFQTPYTHAPVDVTPGPLAAIRLGLPGSLRLEAVRNASDGPTETPEECWEGKIYLPPGNRPDHDRFFFARLAGRTEVYPFAPADLWHLPPDDHPALRALADSHFAPTHWRLRPAAHHARSATHHIPRAAR